MAAGGKGKGKEREREREGNGGREGERVEPPTTETWRVASDELVGRLHAGKMA